MLGGTLALVLSVVNGGLQGAVQVPEICPAGKYRLPAPEEDKEECSIHVFNPEEVITQSSSINPFGVYQYDKTTYNNRPVYTRVHYHVYFSEGAWENTTQSTFWVDKNRPVHQGKQYHLYFGENGWEIGNTTQSAHWVIASEAARPELITGKWKATELAGANESLAVKSSCSPVPNPATQDMCAFCKPGQFQSLPDQTSCESCPKGHYCAGIPLYSTTCILPFS
jgi:hypothetical protein